MLAIIMHKQARLLKNSGAWGHVHLYLQLRDRNVAPNGHGIIKESRERVELAALTVHA